MKKHKNTKEEPATAIQLATAMQALGLYDGQNTEEEHQTEAMQIGNETYYRMLLANALLGAAEVEALHLDSSKVAFEQMQDAHQQALETAGVDETQEKLIRFLQWRTLRVSGPLRQIAQNEEAGPVPLAAAHAAEALQLLLSACASGQNITHADPFQITADLKSARESLTHSLANIDIMLRLVKQVEHLMQ